MPGIDLHLHSTVSDGRYTPAELTVMAAQAGLSAISLTDHDTVEGIVEAVAAARPFPSLAVIPGVEVSTDTPGGEVHILGYFINDQDAVLRPSLEKMRLSRIARARGMVEKLRRLGMAIEWPRVQEIAGRGAIGRPHVAQALLEKGYVSSLREAFTRYIGRDGVAYVEREKMTPGEAVQLIRQADGLPVLAHPFTVTDPETIIRELIPAGLKGLEVYYNNYTPEQTRALAALARRYNLVPSGGSDFHGIVDMETPLGGVYVPPDTVQRLGDLVRELNLR
jgi:predicted metal-dependent phosphoesterase TrpH